MPLRPAWQLSCDAAHSLKAGGAGGFACQALFRSLLGFADLDARRLVRFVAVIMIIGCVVSIIVSVSRRVRVPSVQDRPEDRHPIFGKLTFRFQPRVTCRDRGS